MLTDRNYCQERRPVKPSRRSVSYVFILYNLMAAVYDASSCHISKVLRLVYYD
jgi:hypothetical protein